MFQIYCPESRNFFRGRERKKREEMVFDHDKKRLRKVGWKPGKKKNREYNMIKKGNKTGQCKGRQYSVNDFFESINFFMHNNRIGLGKHYYPFRFSYFFVYCLMFNA